MRRESTVQPIVVPEGWVVQQIRDFAEVRPGGRKGLTKADYGKDGFPAFSAAGQDGLVSVAEYRRRGVILSAIGARCGKCFFGEGEWTTLANTQVILPDESKVDTRYLWQYVNDESYWHRSGSAQPFIAPSTVKSAWVATPPLPEQRRIAAILSSIDVTIEVEDAVLDQLRVLEDLLRRGFFEQGPALNGGARSGAFPENRGAGWFVARGEDLFSLAGGYAPTDVTPSTSGACLFLKVDDLNDAANTRVIVKAKIRFSARENPGIRTYGVGSVVFPKRGAAIFKNRVRLLSCPTAVDPNLMVLTPGVRLDPGFFAHQLLHIGLHNLGDNSGIPQINNKHLYPHEFLVPPLTEQIKIRTSLDAASARTDVTTAHRIHLAEIRSAILAALLSGELRVGPDEVFA